MDHNRQVGPWVHRTGGQDDGTYANSSNDMACLCAASPAAWPSWPMLAIFGRGPAWDGGWLQIGRPPKPDAFSFTILIKKCSKQAAVDNWWHPDLKRLQYSGSLNIILGEGGPPAGWRDAIRVASALGWLIRSLNM